MDDSTEFKGVLLPRGSTSIAVKHNIEVAHRLFETPGKCENIHGHSMWVTMELFGNVNDKGMLAGIDFGALKKSFRSYLDETYDHHVVLNASDPFARPIYSIDDVDEMGFAVVGKQQFLPGLVAMMGDPTTENIARWTAESMDNILKSSIGRYNGIAYWELAAMTVTVWETSVNMACYSMPLGLPLEDS